MKLKSRANARIDGTFAMVMLGSQVGTSSHPPVLKTHTWAAFVDFRQNPPRSFEISWLPADGRINLRRKVGKNYDLDESLAWTRKYRLRNFAWEPFSIARELFHAADTRRGELESGRIWYYFFGMEPNSIYCNCTHALSDLEGLVPLGWGTWAGVAASRVCLNRFQQQNWVQPAGDPEAVKKALKISPTTKITWITARSRLAMGTVSPKEFFTELAKDLPSSWTFE